MDPIEVAGLGNALVDALVRIEDDGVLHRLEATRGHMHPVDHDRWEKAFETVRHLHVDIQSGGSCANSLATLGLLGAQARFCGQVGDDQMGALYLSRMTEACGGHCVVKTDAMATGKCLSMISAQDAERTMFTDLGAAVALDGLGDFEEVIRRSQILHITGYLLLGDPMASRAIEAMRIAKEANVTVSLDVADPFVVATVRQAMWDACVEYSDVVFLNAEEAATLCEDTPDAALASLSHHVGTVVLKLGSRGSLVKADGQLYPVEAEMIDAVDTTGAGDAYAGGYLYGMLRGWDPGRSAKLASRVAALTVSQVGAVCRDEEALRRVVEELRP